MSALRVKFWTVVQRTCAGAASWSTGKLWDALPPLRAVEKLQWEELPPGVYELRSEPPGVRYVREGDE